ncbi:hypothetical protein JB92DRAFT_1217094 [Gautieria morchelliformis]|nr:hypothetical protein JB92DRAFT_1217094 [Gautieria morchelliformis]
MCPSHSVMDSDGLNSVLGAPVYSSHALLMNVAMSGFNPSQEATAPCLDNCAAAREPCVCILYHGHELPSQSFPQTSPCLSPVQVREPWPSVWTMARRQVLPVMITLCHTCPTRFLVMLPRRLIPARSAALPNTSSCSCTKSPRQPTSNNISSRSSPTASESASATIFSQVHPHVTSSAPGSRSNLTFAASTLKSSRPSGAPGTSITSHEPWSLSF